MKSKATLLSLLLLPQGRLQIFLFRRQGQLSLGFGPPVLCSLFFLPLLFVGWVGVVEEVVAKLHDFLLVDVPLVESDECESVATNPGDVQDFQQEGKSRSSESLGQTKPGESQHRHDHGAVDAEDSAEYKLIG